MNQEIVTSAISSFNNAALATPGFFWIALLMLPVYIGLWKIAPDILGYFFPTKKLRDYNFAWIAEISLIVWIVLNHGNWGVVRDSAGFLPYAIAAILFLLCKDAVARLREQDPRVPTCWLKIDRRTKKWLKIGTLLVVVMILARSTLQDFHWVALQVSGGLFGCAAGYFGRRSGIPIGKTTFLMVLIAIAITLQPEYFRFGQLGRLGVIHLVTLAGVVMLGAVIFVFRHFTPIEFIRDNHYKYIKWFMRLCTFLTFILFVMTESVPVLAAFGLSTVVTMWFAVKHVPRETNVAILSGNLWGIMLMLFGMVTVMPLVTMLGILCWKNNNTRSFWKNILGVLQ